MRNLLTNLIIIIAFAFSIEAEDTNIQPDWSFDKSASGYSMQFQISKCYDDNSKATVALYWNDTNFGESKSVSATCPCGQSMLINDTLEISTDSLEKLLKADIPVKLDTFICVDSKLPRQNQNRSGK